MLMVSADCVVPSQGHRQRRPGQHQLLRLCLRSEHAREASPLPATLQRRADIRINTSTSTCLPGPAQMRSKLAPRRSWQTPTQGCNYSSSLWPGRGHRKVRTRLSTTIPRRASDPDHAAWFIPISAAPSVALCVTLSTALPILDLRQIRGSFCALELVLVPATSL